MRMKRSGPSDEGGGGFSTSKPKEEDIESESILSEYAMRQHAALAKGGKSHGVDGSTEIIEITKKGASIPTTRTTEPGEDESSSSSSEDDIEYTRSLRKKRKEEKRILRRAFIWFCIIGLLTAGGTAAATVITFLRNPGLTKAPTMGPTIASPPLSESMAQTIVIESPSTQWTQIGENIVGNHVDDLSMWSVSYSKDGTTIAVAPSLAAKKRESFLRKKEEEEEEKESTASYTTQIYRFSESEQSWKPVGGPLSLVEDDELAELLIGWSVSLSEDGMSVAIGGYSKKKNNVGVVRVYTWVERMDSWIQRGNTIGDDNKYLYSSIFDNTSQMSIELSSDANTLAIGAPNHDDETGMVKVYFWSTMKNDWSLTNSFSSTNSLVGRKSGDLFGHSMSLTIDGQYIAIGVPGGGENEEGRVEVHRLEIINDNGRWIQHGPDISGVKEGDMMGNAVQIANEGKTVAASSGSEVGKVRVYSWAGFFWFPSDDIVSMNEGDQSMFGASISLTANGEMIAIGSPSYNNVRMGEVLTYDNTNVGQAVIYRWNGQKWVFFSDEGILTGTGGNELFGFQLHLSGDGNRIAVTGTSGTSYNGKDPFPSITKIYSFSSR
mmetsp:Transcript_8325/g.9211  ORF Transcript_8325/g.9211 Transcript_8325/m.9211 type:complete len:606 (-) Transcript_8325:166-1983(-)